MSFNAVPDHYTLDYDQNWYQRIQQFKSKLDHTVITDEVNGLRKRYSQFEQQEMEDRTTRHPVTSRQNATSFIRYLNTQIPDISNVLDEWDNKELGEQISPKGALTISHAAAYNRHKDTKIIQAAEGNVTTGAAADVSTPLPNTQQIAVSFNPGGVATDSGLTFIKVARVNRIFADNDLDIEPGMGFAIISPEADENLVVDVAEARDRDFTKISAIEGGTVAGKFWMGWNWIVSTRLTSGDVTGAAGTVTGTNCLFWHKNYMRFGDGEKRNMIDILPGESHAVQIRTSARMGAMRFEEKGVVLCETLVV